MQDLDLGVSGRANALALGFEGASRPSRQQNPCRPWPVKASALAVSSALALMFAQGASAQDAAKPEAPKAPDAAASASGDAHKASSGISSLSEVVITSQKRKQSVFDVAASATVINSATISENNIQGSKDFFALTPNVNLQENGSGGSRTATISIRGINDPSAGGERVAAVSAFAFYVNELSIGNAASDTANPPLYDIESIEVLRGPQGTYFGRNASAGAINIQTKKPDGKFFGQVDFGLGTQKTIMASGVINVPLSNTLFVRQSIQTQRDSGTVTNVGPGGGNSGVTLASSRTALRWLASKDTTVDASLTVSQDKQAIPPWVSTGISPKWGFGVPVDAVRGCGLAPFPQQIDKVCLDAPNMHSDSSSYIASMRVEHKLNQNMALTAIVGWTKGINDSYRDLDGSGLAFINRIGHFVADSKSLEVRLASIGKQTVDWTVGGYGYKDANDFKNVIAAEGVAFGWVPGDRPNENVIHIKRDGVALFADATWNVTPAFSVSLGGRYSKDNDHQTWTDVYSANAGLSLATNDGGVPVPGATYYPNGTDFLRTGGTVQQLDGTDARNSGTDFSPRIALNYKLRPDFSVYGTIAQGYKSPGVRVNPDGGALNISYYKKEKTTNFELGFKGVFFGNTRVEGAIFDTEWKDFQVQVNQTFCLQPDGSYVLDNKTNACLRPRPIDKIVNAGSARSRGLELSVTSRLNESLRVGGALGLLKANYVDYKDAGTVIGQADASGTPIPAAPKQTVTAFVEYNGTTGGNGEYYIRPELNYRSSFLNVVNAAGAPDPTGFGEVIPARTLLNLRSGITFGRTTFSLSAENLTGKKYYTFVNQSITGRQVDVHPRTLFAKMTVTTD